MRRRDGYEDRAGAGRVLAEALRADVGDLTRPLVLALPRGGVPVGAVLAEDLAAPFDVLLVRKIGAPRHRELGLGAISEDGVTVLDDDRVRRFGIPAAALDPIIAEEREELARRARAYRDGRPPASVTGRDVVVVDDGVATGVSAAAALRVLRRREPRRIVLAVPVGSPRGLDDLRPLTDRLVCPLAPAGFRSVGEFYDDFGQVTDAEVVALLAGP